MRFCQILIKADQLNAVCHDPFLDLRRAERFEFSAADDGKSRHVLQFTIAVTAVGCKHRIRCVEVELTAARKNMPDDIRCTLFSQTVRWLAVIRVDLHVFIVPACADRQILQTKAVQQYAIFLCNIHHGLLDFRC